MSTTVNLNIPRTAEERIRAEAESIWGVIKRIEARACDGRFYHLEDDDREKAIVLLRQFAKSYDKAADFSARSAALTARDAGGCTDTRVPALALSTSPPPSGALQVSASKEDLEARYAELKAKNEAATGWGAAVGARHEEMKEIERELRRRSSQVIGQTDVNALADRIARQGFPSGCLYDDGVADLIVAALRRPATTEQVRAAAIEECANIAKAMREKHGNPIGDAYTNGVWDQGVRIEQAIRALAPAGDAGRERVVDGSCTFPDCRCITAPPCPHYAREAEPALWICLLMPGEFPHPESAPEPRIRAWTTSAERAQRFRDVEGLDMRPLFASPQPDARIGREATDTWAYIENLLCEECGLRPDEGLQGQRTNCINAIRNATFVVPNERVVSAAIEFLNSGEGLHKIRVNGKMMTRKDVARALTASTPAGGCTDARANCAPPPPALSEIPDVQPTAQLRV